MVERRAGVNEKRASSVRPLCSITTPQHSRDCTMAATQINNRALLGSYPQNIGILAMDVYFPSQFVEQADLGTFPRCHDSVSS
jgi:hypothetical protein